MGIVFGIVFGIAMLGSAITALPTALVEFERSRTPEVLFRVETARPVVALTIDDGPSTATPEILEILQRFDARATFFVIGEHVRQHPELTRVLIADGHELGHHMMMDEPSLDLAPDVFSARFREMDGILDEFGGSRVFRPASGWYDDRMIREAGSLGYRTVLGSVYPFDAQLPFPAFADWYMRRLVRPGAVLVLHDGAERGVRTAEVLRDLLPALRLRGYDVVPVSELQDLPEPDLPTGLVFP
jgi:peptidoglycan/xylan/chitin deacetylase (PgdA/CDA1 family)